MDYPISTLNHPLIQKPFQKPLEPYALVIHSLCPPSKRNRPAPENPNKRTALARLSFTTTETARYIQTRRELCDFDDTISFSQRVQHPYTSLNCVSVSFLYPRLWMSLRGLPISPRNSDLIATGHALEIFVH